MSRTVRRTERRTNRLIMLVIAVTAALTVSGCAAGQVSQTADQVSAIDGANVDIGQLSIRNARFATPAGASYAKGADVPLLFWLTNQGLSADTLSQITSPIATSVEITGGPATVAGGTATAFDKGGPITITLKGLTDNLVYGKSVPVTFAFDNAGQATTNVPIEIPVERSGVRPTIDNLPAEPTPLWLTGEAGHGEAAEESAPEGSPAEGSAESPAGSPAASSEAAPTSG